MTAITMAGMSNMSSLYPTSHQFVQRKGVYLKPDAARILIRPFDISDDHHASRIIARVMERSEVDVEALVVEMLQHFGDRVQRVREFWMTRFHSVKARRLTDRPLSENRKLVIGAHFTQEYALESAALFNPSMVWHPDQSGLPEGSRRYILSLRATGEGHLSSTVFRSGVIHRDLAIELDPCSNYVTLPVPSSPLFDRSLFARKLAETKNANGRARELIDELGETFTMTQLEWQTQRMLVSTRRDDVACRNACEAVLSLARANYRIEYTSDTGLSERIIFPHSPSEKNGIEDSRFVEFLDDDGSRRYYATYTAFDGQLILPQLLETADFLRFDISTLNGPQATNKGLALFPRKVNGQYAMLGRQDDENLFLMYSDSVHFWYHRKLILRPAEPWEFVKVGNCGSPIETPRGWLVITHGVGPNRHYSIGAALLDLDDPSVVIARLKEPLLTPIEGERRGYVPNVVYSCGGQVFNEHLILPYAMSDYASTFAVIGLQPLLELLDQHRI